MRMLAQLLAAVVLTWKCIAPVDTVRGAGRPREARVQAPSTRSFKRGTQPCCVEAVPGERKMNIFCLSARKILLTLSGFACRYWSSPAGFSTMCWSLRPPRKPYIHGRAANKAKAQSLACPVSCVCAPGIFPMKKSYTLSIQYFLFGTLDSTIHRISYFLSYI
jgi:hypothetical protein